VKRRTKILLFLFFILLLWGGFFGFGENICQAVENDLIITEIMYDPAENESGERVEWIELYANADKIFTLKSNKQLKDFYFCTKKGTENNSCIDSSHIFATYATGDSLDIKKGDIIIATKNPDVFKNISDIKIIKTSSSFNLLSDDNAFISYSEDNKATWKENIGYANFFIKKIHAPSVGGFSLEKIIFSKENVADNWQESFCLDGSPGKESTQQKDCPKIEPPREALEENEIKNYSGKLKINEIFPAPKIKNAGKEFVEIINFSDEIINLSGMRIEDEKNTNKLSFPNKLLAPKELFYLEGDFELNNTTPDTAFLIDKDGTKENPIDLVSYTNPKHDYAYASNGSAWQWTSRETKGAENQFDELLSGQIKKDETIYVGVYANFEVKADNKAEHFTWNFGDGHKSYLKKTRHKYEETGTYSASLKITGESEDNLLNFEVEVKKYPEPKIKIIKIKANPKGKDTEGEEIYLKNTSKKKINLKTWSIATGSKTLANHPITKDFVIQPGKTKKITRKYSLFVLNNKKGALELRYPNGEVASRVKYDKKKESVKDDEIYELSGKKWQWNAPTEETPVEATISPTNISPSPENLGDINQITEPEISDEEISLNLGKYSSEKKLALTEIQFKSAGNNLLQSRETPGIVLGAFTSRGEIRRPVEIKSTTFWQKTLQKSNRFFNFLINRITNLI
jgi:hypothetical protein